MKAHRHGGRRKIDKERIQSLRREKVNVQAGSPQRRKISSEQMPYSHSAAAANLFLEANASFSPDQGSQTDTTVVAGVSTGNNRVDQ